MERLLVLGSCVVIGFVSQAAADALQDDARPNPGQKGSLAAVKALADLIDREQARSDAPRADDAKPAAKPQAAKEDPKPGDLARPARPARRQVEDEEDNRPPRRPPVRQPARPQPPLQNRPVGQFGANPLLVPAGGGPIWDPIPSAPVYYGGYGYGGYGYGGYGRYYPLGYGYGYTSYYGYGGYYFPAPVVTSISGPIDVKYPDPRGSQRETMLEGARKSASNPGGLFPNRR